MDIKAFDSLISDFKSMADTTRSDLTNVIDMLSEGKVPSDELRQRIDESLGDLQNKYGNIYAELQKYATNVECPNSKAGVDFFAETFKRSEELRIREELEKAKAVIEKFLRVTSSVDSYLEALKPYQNNAQQLLDDIIAKKVNDEIDDKIQSEKVFLQILEERFDDSDEDTLYDILGEHYSKKIERGLALKRYFIGGETTGSETKKEPESEQVTEIKKDIPETKLEDTIATALNYVPANGKVKTVKPNATAFAKEINGSNARTVFEQKVANFSRNILALGIRFSVISQELVELDVLVTGSTRKRPQADKSTIVTIIKSALHDLKKKGYILEYELPSLKAPVYCLSPLTEACFKKKTVKDLFPDIEWSKCLHFIGGNQIPKSILQKVYQSNLLLFKYISRDNKALWYEGKELNRERSFKLLTASGEGDAQITDCEVYDRINLPVSDKKTVRCIVDNGYLPESLPENENIFVVDRDHESVHFSRTVYYFDEILTKKAAADNTGDAVKSGDSTGTKISSPASDSEQPVSDKSTHVDPKKENAKEAGTEPQLKTKAQPKPKKESSTKAAHAETDSNEPAQELPKFICAKSKLKTGKADAAQFVKDLTRKNTMDLYSCDPAWLKRQLIMYGIFLGAFTSDWVFQMVVSLDQSAEDRIKATQDISLALSELLKSGYITEYELQPKGESVYCLSPLTEACLKKKVAREIVLDNKSTPLELLFVGTDKVSVEVINKCLLSNNLFARYGHFCANNDYNPYHGFSRHFIVEDATPGEYSGHNIHTIFDEVIAHVSGKEIKCIIDNGTLSDTKPVNVLVVDKKYDSSPLGTKVYYLDDLDAEKTKGTVKKQKAANPDKTSKSKTAAPKQGSLDVTTVKNNPVSNILKLEQGDKKQSGARSITQKTPAPVKKKPEKTEPMPAVSNPVESELTKPETIAPVGKESVSMATDTTNAGVIPELPKKEHMDIYNFEKLLDGNKTPSDEDFCRIVLSLLSGKNATVLSGDSCVAQALLMAKAAAGNSENTKSKRLYEQLLLATRLPLDSLHYTSERLEVVYSDENVILKSARLASYIHALVRSDRAYDFSLTSKCNDILQNFDKEFSSFPELKQLFSELTLIRNRKTLPSLPSGFSDSVLAHLGDAATKDKYVAGLQKSATEFLQTPHGKTGIRLLSKFYELSMGNNSDIYQALSTVAGNQIDDLDIVKACLKDYCEEEKGSFSINQDMVDAKIDEFWSKVTGKDKFPLDFRARSRADNRFNDRIQLMKDWAEYADSVSGEGLDIDKVRNFRSKIVKAATAAEKSLTGSGDAEKNLLAWVVNSLLKFFDKGKERDIRTFAELLHTGVISLDDNGIPVIDDNWHQIKYYEPWRLVLRHIISLKDEENRTLEKVKNNIFENSSPMYDNLQQLKMIGRYTGNEEDVISASNENNINTARKSADGRLEKFSNALDLSFTYGRIDEDEKETILGSANQFKPDFYRYLDFGVWGQFLDVLYKQINEASEVRKAELRKQLQASFDRVANNEGSFSKEPPAILTVARRLLEEESNFTVAEEYINQFDSGNVEATTESLEASLYDPDSFAEFLDDRTFKSIYSECLKNKKESALATFAIKYCENHYPEGWSDQYKTNSNKLINSWPKKVDKNKKAEKIDLQVANVFMALGFTVKSVSQNKKFREEVFEVTATPADKSLPDYPHPIARFGTQNNSPINVVVFREGVDVKQLTDTMTRLNLGELAVVLINGYLDLGKRRQIAEEFHGTSRQNSFIFIDWVLAIFLALHQDSERLPVLLKCALPFTTYQPFVCGGGSTADEMFCGRTIELASLIDPKGHCVVYGGRQLGKTALLERTASRCSKPQNKAYAVYSNVNHCKSEKELVKKLSTDIAANTYLPKLKTDSLQAFCNDILSLFNSNKIVSMHLLMDEVDDFLEAIADDNYIALQPLIDLKRVTKNNFKFVLAGLHNVCRAKNATRNNGVFGQLGEPLCIKPLSPTDALQLLSRPLRYLGFKISRYPHLETILTQTNYYPGILQFFGYKLVENVNVKYSKYYRAANGNPPFILKDDLLGDLIGPEDLKNSIKDKFRLSLKLDDRYYMIARCIALLHYEQDERKLNWLGYEVEDIIRTAKYFDIHCLANEDQDDYILLLDEMVDMGILSRPDHNYYRYRLRRSSFIQIIGPNYDAVFKEIYEENERMAK